MKDELVQDMVEVLTSFPARLYGRRSARNLTKRAIEAISQ
jgi:predicted site-specific integrase-resolvase